MKVKIVETIKKIGGISRNTLIVVVGALFILLATNIYEDLFLSAAVCSIPETVSTTVEITPLAGDNIIDCSGQDITVVSGGNLVLKSYYTSDTSTSNDGGVDLRVINLTVDVGGQITSDGEGYLPGDVDGGSAEISTGVAAGSGGGHGGAGGVGNTAGGGGDVVGASGTTIGSKNSPLTLGGAGGTGGGGGLGGNGGGAMKITATGTTTINGTISADGLDGIKSGDNQTAGGGGAGGSIWIESDILSGIGNVQALGGGSDVTASYYGGGGGGGRVVMIATTSSTFTNVSVAQGTGSQDGGVGTLIGPGVRPVASSILKVYESNVAAGLVDRELLVGEYTRKTSLTFASDLVSTNEKLEIELIPTVSSFQNVPTNAQIVLSGEKTCTGIPETDGVSIGDYCGFIETTGLSVSTEYKWQARIINSVGIFSDWVQFGGNGVGETDFTVVGGPVTLEIIQGDNQTVVAGEIAPTQPTVKVMDSAGYGVPFLDGFLWSVLVGNGSLSNSEIISDSFGLIQTDWTLGTAVGTDNNSIKIDRASAPTMNAVFTASVTEAAVDHYVVDTGGLSTSLINTDFSYNVSAEDQYGNSVSVDDTLDIYPVSAYDDVTPGLGTLTPTTLVISGGTGTVSDAQYTYKESLKVKVVDSIGNVGFSDSILFVDSLGLCPAVIVDSSQTWNAIDVPNGIYDCTGLGKFWIKDSSILTLNSYNNGDALYDNDYGVTILMDSLQIDSDNTILGDYLGYADHQGPGDAMHGGYSPAPITGQPYGSIYEPIALGSGGSDTYFGTAGSGGGAIKLDVIGDTILNGVITSNGQDGGGTRGDGGAGGSVWLDTDDLSGSGIIRTNGGVGASHSDHGSGGSGGRIAVYYNTNTGFSLAGTNLQSFGGNSGIGYSAGGTVYLEHKGVDTIQQGTLLVDNDNHNVLYNAGVPHGDYVFSVINVTRYGHVEFIDDGGDSTVEADHMSLGVSSGVSFQGDSTKPLIKVLGTLNYTAGEILTLDGVTLGLYGKEVGIDDMTIGATNLAELELYPKSWYYNNSTPFVFGDIVANVNGVITMIGYNTGDTDWTNDYGVTMNSTGLTINSGGLINSTGLGYGIASGPGYISGGVSHGGYANDGNEDPYGSLYEPVDYGSGGPSNMYGPGGRGGGAVKLVVSGILLNNGAIESNGGDGRTSGSGGSIWVDTGTLSGSGIFSVDGGISAKDAPSSAAGRIAIYYDNNIDFPLVPDNIHAYGGVNSWSVLTGVGGPGTVYIEDRGVDIAGSGLLIVDNNGYDTQYAGVLSGDYSFKEIQATGYGHVEFMDNGGDNPDPALHSSLEISSGAGIQGDSTRSEIKSSGILNYTGAETLIIDGVSLGVNGKVVGINDVVIGSTLSSGLALYAHTWYHNDIVPYEFGDVYLTGLGNIDMYGYVSGISTDDDHGVYLEATGLTMDIGSLITTDYYGYQRGDVGFGQGEVYGGFATTSTGIPYGSPYEPTLFGGSGTYDYFGTLGAGGGAMKISVSGDTILNGIISANGQDGTGISSDAGAGGSIWLDTVSLSGSGVVRTNGGVGVSRYGGGGGSGGRIAIYYDNNIDFPLSGANLQSYGGNAIGSGNNSYSGPGTVYIEDRNSVLPQNGILLVDNNNNNALSAGIPHGDYSFSQLVATRYGHVEFIDDGGNSIDPLDHMSLEVSSSSGLLGDSTKSEVKVSGVLNYTSVDTLDIEGVSLGINGKIIGVSDLIIGDTLSSGLVLYANTWHHSDITPYQFGDVYISAYGNMDMVGYVSGISTSEDHGVYLEVTGLTIDAGGKISGDYRGYQRGDIGYGQGEAYGGYATTSSGIPYGSIYEPLVLGPSGTHDYFGLLGAGGGAMKITVTGTTILNGDITSNGQSGTGTSADGGSGGSILLDTVILSGTGTIQTNGALGVSDGGGGSGGRIGVYYDNNIDFLLSGDHLQSYGGDSGENGVSGPGTVYVEDRGVVAVNAGILIIDNNNLNGLSAGVIEGEYQFSDILLSSYGDLEFIGENGIVNVISGASILGDNTKPVLGIEGTLVNISTDEFIIDGYTLDLIGKIDGFIDLTIGGAFNSGLNLHANTWAYDDIIHPIFNDITVNDLGVISVYPYNNSDSDYTNDYGYTIQTNNLLVEVGGVIESNGKGYVSGKGPGFSNVNSGGAYGGYNGENNATTYGDFRAPIDLGGGGSNSGGGAIKIVASNTLINNGLVESNGLVGTTVGLLVNGGGGSGGSIYINAPTINGSGIFKANGGNGSTNTIGSGGGGGGGRIALYYEDGSFPFDDENYIQTHGGTVYLDGGPGTVYIENIGVHEEDVGDLYIRNQGVVSRGNDFRAENIFLNNFIIGENIIIKVESNTSEYTDYSTISESQNLLSNTLGRGVLFDLNGNFVLGAGALIDGSGIGFISDLGNGKGQAGVGYSGGGGGGNGGEGGNGEVSGGEVEANGGATYGDQLIPLTVGSGGGSGSTGVIGGSGGGALSIIARGMYSRVTEQYVDGNLQIYGDIQMNGTDGLTGSPGGGGGAAGSILLIGNTCDISGDLFAVGGEGGNSDVDGGSGGGGRVSVLYNTGPCDILGTVNVSQGLPSDPINYAAHEGQVGTFPPLPNSVPWPSSYREQFEIRILESQSEPSRVIEPLYSVLGVTESIIPLGGVINSTTVNLKADAYDAGARALSPKRLKIRIELKTVGQEFDGINDIYESEFVTFYGGIPEVLDITIDNLTVGDSYKWRVQTVNIDNNTSGPWEDFGENGDSSDFTITSVGSLDLSVDPIKMDVTDSASLTVTAKDSSGDVDDSYRGTVQFSSDSSTATLPLEYTFTSEDNGIHSFPSSVKFYESGIYSIVAQDVVNSSLFDEVDIEINQVNDSFITLTASNTNIPIGGTTILSWNSSQLSDLEFDQGIGVVDISGSTEVSPPEGITKYTVTGTTEDNQLMSASVSINSSDNIFLEETDDNLNQTTDVIEVCPEIIDFSLDRYYLKKGDLVNITWDVINAESIFIDILPGELVSNGSSSIIINESKDISLIATNGDCSEEQSLRVDVVKFYPWEITGGYFIGLIVLQFLSLLTELPVFILQAIFALLKLFGFRKDVKPYGRVYDSITKNGVSRVIVRIYRNNELVWTEVTDSDGIFNAELEDGKYRIVVKKVGYAFPSKIVLGKTDSFIENIYHGEEVKINKEDILSYAIPIDKEDSKLVVKIQAIFKSNAKDLVKRVISALFFLGLLISIYLYIKYPEATNLAILFLYLPSLIYPIFSKRKVGRVVDEDNRAVKGIEVGLKELQFDRFVGKRITDESGSYRFIAKEGKYELVILSEGYTVVSFTGGTGTVEVVKKDDNYLIRKKIVVSKK